VHGTFLDSKRLPEHVPCRWKVDSVAHFADPKAESFRLDRVHAIKSKEALATQTSAQEPPAKEERHGNANAAPGNPQQGTNFKNPVLTGVKATTKLNQISRKMVEEVPLQSIQQASNPNASLYPGDWDVPADGLSSFFRWNPEKEKNMNGEAAKIDDAATDADKRDRGTKTS